MQSPPISRDDIERRIAHHLDELLQLWRSEQGVEKERDLKLIASALPFPRSEPVRVLDLCCGPGDVGRAIHRAYPDALVDAIDRDPFLTAICRGVNRREGVPGEIIVADLNEEGWQENLAGPYDVVATANAIHWFDVARAERLLEDTHRLLREGGVFLFAEPAAPEPPFAAGFDEWKATQPARYSQEAWQRFWGRANAILGYDHTKLLGPRHTNRIEDDMSVAGWVRLVGKAGFGLSDILLRDADEVIIAAMKT